MHQQIGGKPLVYFDNAATSQKPTVVLDCIHDYYRRYSLVHIKTLAPKRGKSACKLQTFIHFLCCCRYNSNVHSGVHNLSAQATAAFEEARNKVAKFVNAKKPSEIVYTKNASEAMNLVAHSWGLDVLKPGDEVGPDVWLPVGNPTCERLSVITWLLTLVQVLLSVAEHHSNLVPWQLVAKRTGAKLRHVPLTKDTEELDMKVRLDSWGKAARSGSALCLECVWACAPQAFHELLSEKTKMVSLGYVSNVLGSVAPVQQIAEAAHKVRTAPQAAERQGCCLPTKDGSPAGGRQGAAGRIPGCAAHASRRAGHWRRLLGGHCTQALRPDRRRLPLGQVGACVHGCAAYPQTHARACRWVP